MHTKICLQHEDATIKKQIHLMQFVLSQES